MTNLDHIETFRSERFKKLDKKTQHKVKVATIGKMLERFEKNPNITDDDLRIFFGFDRETLYEKFPQFRPENRKKQIAKQGV